MVSLSFIPDIAVSNGALDVASVLAEVPLATVRDLSRLMRHSSSFVYGKVSELKDAGFVDFVSLGSTLPLSMRYFLTHYGLEILGRLGGTWSEEPARCRLLERLSSLEWFYLVSGSVRELGCFQGFQWVDGVSFDAVARYEHGWIALFWSGVLQSESTLLTRFGRLGPDLNDLSVLPETPWPSRLFFVVSDPWQRELVYRAARRTYMDGDVSVWSVSDDSRSGSFQVRRSRGWVSQPVYVRDAGGWSWDNRIESSIWSRNRGSSIGKVLEAVAQWPGCDLEFLRSCMGEGSSGRSAHRALQVLRDPDVGMVSVLRDRHRLRYRITGRGRDLLARRDRVSFAEARGRGEGLSWVESPRLREHEEGVMSFLSAFVAAGRPVAAGWRSWEHLGGSGGISPDGLVHMERSPFGPTWGYLEYERSARGQSRIRRKMRGYASGRRSNNWPVLVVCWDERAESIFSDVGSTLGVPMLTTTIGRLSAHGPLGNQLCWLDRGAPAQIG